MPKEASLYPALAIKDIRIRWVIAFNWSFKEESGFSANSNGTLVVPPVSSGKLRATSTGPVLLGIKETGEVLLVKTA